MACSNSRYNVILLSLWLLLLCSLSQCTNLKRKTIQENVMIQNKNHGKRLYWHHGKLLIGIKKEQHRKPKEAKDFGYADLDYQSDMAWEVPGQHIVHQNGYSKYDNSAVERLLKMNPMVDCSGGYMRLQVQDADSKPGALLFVDRGDLSPLPLSKLPKSCGYKVSSMRRDLVMVAPYDGCFVMVEEARYVLPLRWLGVPVQMSCPLSQPSSYNTPMVTCHSEGMVVKTDWTFASEIKVNLNGRWEPLTQASPRCGFSIVEHPEGVTISITYNPCLEKRDGMYSLKMSGDGEIKLSCPSLASPNTPKKPVMDVGLLSTSSPTHNVIKTPQVPEYPIVQPPPPGQIWHQFYPLSWYQQSEMMPVQPVVPQPADDKMVEQPFSSQYPEQPLPDSRPNPGSMHPGLEEPLEQFYHPIYPDLPNLNEDQAHPSQPEYPSQDMTPLFYPEWFPSESQMPHPVYPFLFPQDPVKPTTAPKPIPTRPPKPEGPVVPPVYLYPLYYPTEPPEVQTASPPPTVPQHQPYQLFGPYYYPLPSQHLSHMTTIPPPSTQKPQDPPISRPQHPPPTVSKPPAECPQYCPVGRPNCCPQIAFHQHHHHYHHQQNGNTRPPFFPQAGLPTGSRHDSGYPPPPDHQEAPVPPRRTPYTNARQSPPFLSHRRHGMQTYHQPLEGNPATLAHSRQSEQTDLEQPAHPHFIPNMYLPYKVDMNPRNPHILSEALSGGGPRHSPELFDTVHRTNLYVPYKMQSEQQSDGPSLNPPTPNLLSRIRQYVSLQESQDNFPNNQPINGLKMTKREETKHMSSEPKGYVLLQHGPQGRESSNSFQVPSYRQVAGVSDNMGPNLASLFQNEFLNLRRPHGDYENSRRLEGENSSRADLTPGDEPGPLPQMPTSAGPNSAPLSQDPAVSGKTSFREPQKPFLSFGYRHRT